MALQGTLDTFALADLVRLLATTGKTGRLTIDGDRGHGSLWFVDGALVAGEPAAADVADAVFALLRMEEGDFAFAADARTDDAGEPVSALEALGAAEARLEEWLPVAELVPSALVTLTLREDLPADEVTIDRDRWSRLLLVAGGTTAGAFGAALDLDEMSTGFAVRDLVDAGLIEVGPPAPEPVAVFAEEPAVEEPTVVAAGPVVDLAPTDVAPDPADAVALTPESPASVLADDERYQLGDWEDPEELARPLLPLPADDLTALVDVAPEAEPETEPEAVAEAAPERPLLATDDSWATAEVAPSALGPWEPLTPAAEAPTADDAPATDEPVDAPAVAPWTEATTTAPAADLPAEPGSLDVDLDRQLGASAPGHSYLGSTAAPAGLPEPLLGGPEPLLGGAPEPLLEPAPSAVEPMVEPAAAAEAAPAAGADDDRPWAAADDAGDLTMDSLSPAAARAVAAAAHGDQPNGGDTDAGRRVLRRIISTGKG